MNRTLRSMRRFERIRYLEKLKEKDLGRQFFEHPVARQLPSPKQRKPSRNELHQQNLTPFQLQK